MMSYRTYGFICAFIATLFIASLFLFRFVNLWWLTLTVPTGAVIPWLWTLPLSRRGDRWIRP